MWIRISAWFRREREKLAPMSPKKKWGYIWEYYKWWILGFVLLLCIAVTGIQDYRYQQKQVLISGIFLNTTTSEEGYGFVKEDYWEYTGADDGTRAELIEARTIDFYVEQPTSTDVSAIMSVDAQIAAASLDYMICDASAVEFYGQREVCLDLRSLFPEQQLAQWNTVETESGVIAIDLTGSRLEQEFGLYAQPTYIIILANTPHPENCVEFVNYLFQFV